MPTNQAMGIYRYEVLEAIFEHANHCEMCHVTSDPDEPMSLELGIRLNCGMGELLLAIITAKRHQEVFSSAGAMH